MGVLKLAVSKLGVSMSGVLKWGVSKLELQSWSFKVGISKFVSRSVLLVLYIYFACVYTGVRELC